MTLTVTQHARNVALFDLPGDQFINATQPLKRKQTMPTFGVTMPIGGHAYVEVEAETEEQAKELAMDQVSLTDIDGWEILDPVSQGNVLSFPSPWEIEVAEIG